MIYRFFILFFVMALFLSSCAEANDKFLEEVEITAFCLKDTEQIVSLELEDDGLVSESNHAAARHLLKVCESWVISDIEKYEAFFSDDPNIRNAIYDLYSLYERVNALSSNSRIKWIDFKLSAEERKHRVIPAIERIKDRRKVEISNGAGLALQDLFTE